MSVGISCNDGTGIVCYGERVNMYAYVYNKHKTYNSACYRNCHVLVLRQVVLPSMCPATRRRHCSQKSTVPSKLVDNSNALGKISR